MAEPLTAHLCAGKVCGAYNPATHDPSVGFNVDFQFDRRVLPRGVLASLCHPSKRSRSARIEAIQGMDRFDEWLGTGTYCPCGLDIEQHLDPGRLMLGATPPAATCCRPTHLRMRARYS